MEEQRLLKYIAGDLSSDERAEVCRWIKASDDNLAEYKLLRRLHDLSLWNEALPKPARHRRRIVRAAYAFACCAALLLVGGLMYYAGKDDAEEPPVYLRTISAPFGRELKMQLADGSDVWLNSGSTLTVDAPDGSDARRVTLEGEGYFKVAHDPEHPFIVKAGDLEVKVLGTEFNLCSYPDKGIWETALFSGSVCILDAKEKELLTIAPGTKISCEGQRLVASAINLDEYLWKDGIIYFDDTPLTEIFAKLSEYYDIEIKYSGLAHPDKRYTGKFRAIDGIDHILDILKYDNKFSYRTVTDSDNSYILINK